MLGQNKTRGCMLNSKEAPARVKHSLFILRKSFPFQYSMPNYSSSSLTGNVHGISSDHSFDRSACRIHIGINKIFASDKVLMRVQTFLFKLIFLVSLHITHYILLNCRFAHYILHICTFAHYILRQ